MDIAALITWIATALGGFYLLGTWISKGGPRQQQVGTSRLPAPVVFGHFLLAAAGLVVWIVYVAADLAPLAWTAFGLLVVIAILGFTLLVRWIPVHRGEAPFGGTATPAERSFPVAVVAGHGLFAVTTVVLVLLAALGVGGS